jgi:chromosome segregation ATPase
VADFYSHDWPSGPNNHIGVDMTDLATRIADVKHEEVEKMIAAWLEYAPQSMQPMVKEAVALLRHMAARIEELQAKADDWQTMKDELDMARFGYQAIKEDTDSEIAGLRKRNEELEKKLTSAREIADTLASDGSR